MNDIILFIFAVVFTSFFEWVLHKHVMHKPVGRFRYPYEAHAVVHHHIFKADETYHLQKEEDKHTIRMAIWNILVLLPIASAPWLLVSYFVGDYSIVVKVAIVILLYYFAYEYVHWCMHLPKKRKLEMLWIFRFLNTHHLLHHRYMQTNFNVVLPIADIILGTKMWRPKTRFKQELGPMFLEVTPQDPK